MKFVFLLLFVFISIQIVFSLGARPERAQWGNVPSAPSLAGYQASFLGDVSLASRMVGMLLQNFGGSGGRVIPLSEYNLENVAEWMNLGFTLNPKSQYLPFLAAYYFGATQDASELRPLAEFLAHVGRSNPKENWRWMSNAVYLARFKLEDFDLAVQYADELASMYEQGMPALIAQMPAFVQLQLGEKEAAYAIMLELLRESSDKMHPNEVNFMVDYICNRTLSEVQKAKDPLCVDLK